MATIFTRIVNGEIPCYKVAEDERFLAFLDINPLQEGHTLIIPKKEIDYIFDIEDDLHAGLWNFAKKIASAIEKVVPCKRIGVTVIGLDRRAENPGIPCTSRRPPGTRKSSSRPIRATCASIWTAVTIHMSVSSSTA